MEPINEPNRRRRRRTLRFDAATIERLLGEALALEQARLAQDRGLPWPVPLDAGSEVGLRQALQGLLKACTDAARPARGLPLGPDGLPPDLPGLVLRGWMAGQEGTGMARVLRNIQAGAPVDQRLAEAVLAFFRVVLRRPALRLDEIGAAQTDRAEHAKQSALDLPAQALGRLRSALPKAREMAGYAWMLDDYLREYRDLRLVQDERGVLRIALERISRYKPLKLVDFECPHRPQLAYEWYEWARYEQARLVLRQLDARGRCRREWELALHKRLDEAGGLVRYELQPQQPPEVQRLLAELARARTGRQPPCELEWRERLLLNAADRDLLVSYAPIARLRVQMDPAAAEHFRFSVGDAPGLVWRDGAWQLERALLPREVLAVRLRWAALREEDALRASPAGEIVRDLPLTRGIESTLDGADGRGHITCGL